MQSQDKELKRKTYIHLVVFNHGKNRLEVSGSFEMFVELLRGLFVPQSHQTETLPIEKGVENNEPHSA